VDNNSKLTSIPLVDRQLYEFYRERAVPFEPISVPPTVAKKRIYSDRPIFTWDAAKSGSRILISEEFKKASTSDPWNQVQSLQPLLPGNDYEVLINSICPRRDNTYGIVVGIGPSTVAKSGPTAIIGYSGNSGIGYVGNDGTFFPPIQGRTFPTFATGDRIRVLYNEDSSFSFFKNGDLINSMSFISPTPIFPTVAISSGAVTLV